MRWSRSEIDHLFPILEQVSSDLAPLDYKKILVLCSWTGEVAFWLGEMMEFGRVTGLELDPEALDIAQRAVHEMGLGDIVEFKPAELDHIPLPDASFDGLVSDFIIYPTTSPTQIGQSEMARLLVLDGRMILTDVIVTRPLPDKVRTELATIGVDYLRQATRDDYHQWMKQAGLINVAIQDLTASVRQVWEARREADPSPSHQPGYSYLLDNPLYALGRAIFYIYVRGMKPKTG